jgi:DNA-binding CsgD family transcriptional regulator
MTRRLKILSSPLRAVSEPAELFAAVERHAGVGVWVRTGEDGELEWSDNMYRLLGFEPGERPASVESAAERMPRADAQTLRTEVNRTPRDGAKGLMRYRVVHPDGTIRVLESRPVGGWQADESGQPVLVGTARDITDQVAAEPAAAWRRALEELFGGWDVAGNDVGEDILSVLAPALGAPAAALWAPDGDSLTSIACWTEQESAREGLATALAADSPVKGIGMAGGAWKSAEVTLLRPGVKLPSASRFLPGGVRPVLAVPALHRGEVLAVLVLYRHSCLEGADVLREELAASRATLGVLLRHRLRIGRRSRLTVRELEVLQLAADGLGGQEIEARLRLSRSTVKSHFENIYDKLGVRNRPAAVAYAMRDGLIV